MLVESLNDMRVFAVVIFLFLSLTLSSCAEPRGSVVRGVEVTAVEWDEGEGEDGSLPERIVLAVDIENRSATAVLHTGRIRIGYSGRRVLIFTLDGRVKIPRKRISRVMIPLRVNMVHNSQALAFREALLRHDASAMEIDWEVTGRAGVVKAHIEQPAKPLTMVLSEPMLTTLWQIMDEMKEQR